MDFGFPVVDVVDVVIVGSGVVVEFWQLVLVVISFFRRIVTIPFVLFCRNYE
jgi:hypothetical protein